MEKAGINELEVPVEYLIAKSLPKLLLIKQQVKLLAQAGDDITAGFIKSVEKSGIESIKTLYINEIECGPYISDTLKLDTTRNQLEALVEIYRMMRPGEPPTKEAAEALFKNLFFTMTVMIYLLWVE